MLLPMSDATAATMSEWFQVDFDFASAKSARTPQTSSMRSSLRWS
jgi:hypothetical protein